VNDADYSGLPAVASRSRSAWLVVFAGLVTAFPLSLLALVAAVLLLGPVSKL